MWYLSEFRVFYIILLILWTMWRTIIKMEVFSSISLSASIRICIHFNSHQEYLSLERIHCKDWQYSKWNQLSLPVITLLKWVRIQHNFAFALDKWWGNYLVWILLYSRYLRNLSIQCLEICQEPLQFALQKEMDFVQSYALWHLLFLHQLSFHMEALHEGLFSQYDLAYQISH